MADILGKNYTGLLVLEVINSNPNGDPDNEGSPRQRADDLGKIAGVSFTRKIRDLVDDKEGPVWQEIGKKEMNLNDQNFAIFESRGRDRKSIERELKNGSFQAKYWDGRVFGNTFLEEKMTEKGLENTVKTGVAKFGLGISVAPIAITSDTLTNKAGVQEGKDRGMAPGAYAIVQHGVYCMPFFVNPSMAHKSGCTQQDIDLLFKVIPYAYAHTRSFIRTQVEIRHAWVVEQKSVLGGCSDHDIWNALTPKKKGNLEEPSVSWDDYIVPTGLPEELVSRVASVRDLMVDAYC